MKTGLPIPFFTPDEYTLLYGVAESSALAIFLMERGDAHGAAHFAQKSSGIALQLQQEKPELYEKACANARLQLRLQWSDGWAVDRRRDWASNALAVQAGAA